MDFEPRDNPHISETGTIEWEENQKGQVFPLRGRAEYLGHKARAKREHPAQIL